MSMFILSELLMSPPTLGRVKSNESSIFLFRGHRKLTVNLKVHSFLPTGHPVLSKPNSRSTDSIREGRPTGSPVQRRTLSPTIQSGDGIRFPYYCIWEQRIGVRRKRTGPVTVTHRFPMCPGVPHQLFHTLGSVPYDQSDRRALNSFLP